MTHPEAAFPSRALELENSGAAGVDLAIIQKIERFNLFASAQTAIPREPWLATSLVIEFKGFHTESETKALAALTLRWLPGVTREQALAFLTFAESYLAVATA